MGWPRCQALTKQGLDSRPGVASQGNPDFLAILEDHRSRLEKWIIDTADQGSETKEVYLIEIEDQIRSTRNPDTREIYRKNSQTYLNWMHADK